MAAEINKSNVELCELIEKVSDNEIKNKLYMKIAKKDFYVETQLMRDYTLIRERIMSEMSEINANNIVLQKAKIEIILNHVLVQFQERKFNTEQTIQRIAAETATSGR